MKLYSFISTISYILHIFIYHNFQYLYQYFETIYKSGLLKLCFDNFNNLLKLLVVIYLSRSVVHHYHNITHYNNMLNHYKISFVKTQSSSKSTSHPYCFFSTSEIINYTQQLPILCSNIISYEHLNITENLSTLPIYYIKNKAFNEGIYNILFNFEVWNKIRKILIEINAKNIYPVNTIFLKINNIKQYQPIYGQFKIEIVKHHPKFD